MLISSLIAAGAMYYLGAKIVYAQEKKAVNLVRHLPLDEAKEDKNLGNGFGEILNIITSDHRKNQLSQFGSAEKSEEEKMVDGKIELSLAMFVGAIASKFYFPLSLFMLPPAISLSTPFYKRAWEAGTKERRVVLETIGSVVFTVMMVKGYFVLASLEALLYFINRKLLLKTEDSSLRNMGHITGEMPKKVWLVKEEVEIEIPLERLEPHQIISVNAGEMIPVDGRIIKGFAMIDERMLTGESQPAEKKIGDKCFAATLLLEGKVYIQVEKIKEDTVAHQIGDALQKGLDYRDEMTSKGQKLADQTALPLILLSGLSYPLVGASGSVAIGMSSYGYNLRMVSPMIVLNYLSIASQEGILIKDGRALELVPKIDTIVFDKTGTLTMTQPSIEKIHLVRELSENVLLQYAAAAEYRQTHPIALAIIEAAKERGLELPKVNHTKVELGYGLKVKMGKKEVRVGSARYMEMEKIAIPEAIQSLRVKAQLEGNSLVYVAIDFHLEGTIEISPTIRPEAKKVVQTLQSKGIDCYIISGDHQVPTQQLAKKLGISNFFAEVLPQEKANLVALLQNQNRTVCFVGDGINDAIALKKANVSISLNGATTIATDTAQIIMVDESLRKVPLLFELGAQFDETITRNYRYSVAISAFTIAGIFLLNFGIIVAFWSNKLSQWVGMGNSVQPLINYSRAKKKQKKLAEKQQRKETPVQEVPFLEEAELL